MSIEQVPEQNIGVQLQDIIWDLYTRWDPEYTYSIGISPEPLLARPKPVLTRIKKLEAADANLTKESPHEH